MVVDEIVHYGAYVVDGLSRGFLYAMFGLGVTLVFGMGGILNLAIGVFMVIAILLAFEITGVIGVSVGAIVLAIVVAILLTSLLGLGIERTVFPLVYRSEGEERLLLGIFVTLGLALAMEGIIALRYAGDYTIPVSIPSWEIYGTYITGSSILIIIFSFITLLGMYFFFNRTEMGIASRTIMQDETGARLCGIDIRRMRTGIWILSIGIAAFAGLLYGIRFNVNVGNTFELTTIAIIVSIVGGVTSVSGVVVAGLLLGIISTFVTAFGSTYLASISLFAIAIVVLLVKPEGLQ